MNPYSNRLGGFYPLWLTLLLFFAAVFTTAFNSHAQEGFVKADPRFDVVALANMPTLGIVRKIVQGPKGFLWLATTTGLYRYDGFELKPVHVSGAPDVFDITFDRHGQLWLASLLTGLYQYSPVNGQTRQFKHQPNNPDSLTDDGLSRLSLEGDRLWVASGFGLSSINVLTSQVTRHIAFGGISVEGFNVKDMLFDDQQRLWIATFEDGLYLWHSKSDTMQHFGDKLGGANLVSNKVIRVMQDNQGLIWIGTFNGSLVYDEVKQTFIHIKASSGMVISSMTTDSDNNIWVGTWSNGALRVSAPASADLSIGSFDVQHFMPNRNDVNSLPSNEVFDIFQDRQHNLWFASNGTFAKLKIGAQYFSHLNNPRQAPCNIKGIKQSKDDSIWFNCSNDLYRLPAADKEIDILKPTLATNDAIYEIEEGNADHLWLSFRNNTLLRYHPSSQQTTYYHPGKHNSALEDGFILDMLYTSRGQLWVGAYAAHLPQKYGHLYLYNPQKDAFEVVADKVNVLTVNEINDNHLLLTTVNGIFDFHTNTHQLKRIGDLAQISRTNTSYKDSQNTIWVSIFESGLFTYSLGNSLGNSPSSGEFKQVILPNVEPSIDIINIVEDAAGDMWFSTAQQLFRYQRQSGQIDFVTAQDGLQISKYTRSGSMVSRSGQLLLTGINNLVRFSPEKVFGNAPAAPVVLTQFKLLNQTVPLQSEQPTSVLGKDIAHSREITLSYQDYLLSFDFAVLDFYHAPDNQYGYKLEGLDEDWLMTNASNRTATYTTLPAGDYTFRVKNRQSSGWVEAEPVVLHITPPPWLTWQAYLMYFIMLLAGVYFLLDYRTRAYRKQAAELEQGISDRTQELQEKTNTISSLLDIKKRLFTNVSHEFRTPLTLIISPIEVLMNGAKDEKEQAQFLLIKRNADRLLRLVEQLLAFARLDSPQTASYQAVSLTEVIEQVSRPFEFTLEQKQQSLTIHPFEELTLWLLPDSLEKILINLLSNAIKYTPEQGAIVIDIKQQSDRLLIMVADNGIGIKPSDQQGVFNHFTRVDNHYTANNPGSGIGLALVKELVEANQGTLTLKSSLGDGSVFTVSLPVDGPKQASGETAPTETQNDSVDYIQQEVDSLVNLDDDPQAAPASQAKKLPMIQIIEDNPQMRQFIREQLSDQFYCLTSANGEAGCELATEQIPDLIICDVMMPGISGFTVAKRLKEAQNTSHIPIIMLTAKGDQQSRMQGWQHHVDAYLSKPFNVEELKLRINNLLLMRERLRVSYGQVLQPDATAQSNTAQPDKAALENEAQSSTELSELNAKELKFIATFESIIADNYSNSAFKRADAASLLAMSERQLTRKLDALFTDGFAVYLRKHRLQQAKALIGTGLSVTQIGDDVGFNSPSYFINCFKAEYGKTVRQYENEASIKSRDLG